jgi:hypothetical protein
MSGFEIDAQDYRALLQNVLRQAIDDYIKLQPPNQRRRTYLQEAFQDAVDMLFDSEYRALNIKNPHGEDISLKELIQLALDKDSVSPKQLAEFRESIIQQSLEFWENKDLNTLYIPRSLVIDGHVYTVVQDKTVEEYDIDFEDKIVFLSGDFDNSTTHQHFIHVVALLMFHHTEISMSAKNIEAISKILFRTLKMNSCFLGN